MSADGSALQLIRCQSDPHLLSDRPDEAGELSCNCSNDDRGLLASGDHRAITSTQPHLCLPGNIADFFG